tara:strand:- start:1811 stop:2179 length:369 start_codon:yes stop_codon:yes gene_type:complete
MKHSIHNIQHKAKKAIRETTIAPQIDKPIKDIKTYSDSYYNNLYASRPSVHKSALNHYLKQLQRHKKIQSNKKHSKRTSPGEINDLHPYTKMGHNPNYDIKHKQEKINQASHLGEIKSRKMA